METKADYQIAREELQALWAKHVRNKNLKVDIAGPNPNVVDDRPSMKYCVMVNGESFEYSLGTGHAGMNKFNGREFGFMFPMSNQERNGLMLMNAGKRLKDKHLEARIACVCAAKNKVKPDAAEVIACVCDDFTSASNAGDFESWCSEFGYDTDSRKADDIYRKCIEFQGKLKRIGLSREQITKFAELHAQL